MAETAVEDAVDAQLVDEQEGPGVALERREPPLSIVPQATAAELGQRLALIEEAMRNEMRPGVDYGVIPGTNSKPTLLKPGAEKLSVLFRLDVQYRLEKQWQGDHLTVFAESIVYDQLSGARLGAGEAVCSTREKKYAYRKQELTCPDCGQPAVLQSRKDDEPGFFCWRRKDGCGNKFAADDERLTRQEVGQVDNPDLADAWNTVVKMAKKRALIDGVLVATSASAIFTQDVEDHSPNGNHSPSDPERPHGPQVDASQRTRASNACVKLCSGSTDGARVLYASVVQACGGYMPYAAGLALVKAAEKLDAVPFDPNYRDPTGDVPTGEQVRQEAQQIGEPSAEALAGLGDEVCELWIQAGDAEAKARKRVADCHGKWNALQLSKQAAERTIAGKGRVGA